MNAKLGKAVRAAIPPGHWSIERAEAYVRAALERYRSAKRGESRPSISAQRAQLKKAVNHAAKLSACLETLGLDAAIRLPEHVRDTDVVQYRETVEKLKVRAEQARKSLAAISKRVPKDLALHELLGSLVLVWSQAHPKQHGVTRGSRGGDNHVYRGALLDFAHAVLQIAGIELTRSALGKRLYTDHLMWKSNRRVPNTD